MCFILPHSLIFSTFSPSTCTAALFCTKEKTTNLNSYFQTTGANLFCDLCGNGITRTRCHLLILVKKKKKESFFFQAKLLKENVTSLREEITVISSESLKYLLIRFSLQLSLHNGKCIFHVSTYRFI